MVRPHRCPGTLRETPEWLELEGSGARVGISGATALTQDFDDEVFSRMKVVVPVVLGVTFIVLLVFTRLVTTRGLRLGLAFAVALDASLVRLVLVPALMTLLGAYNWWVQLYSGRERSRQRPLRDDAVESRAGGWC